MAAVDLYAYVTGDVTTVTQLLSQVAIVFDGGAFEVAAKVFVLAGILVGLFSGLMRGGQVSPITFVLPILILLIGVVPKVNLVIEDSNGALSKVDDLPVLAAAPVSLITSIGFAVSSLLTDNLGLDDTTVSMDNGHIFSVRAPVDIANVLTNPEMNSGFSLMSNGIDINTDIPRYMSRCFGFTQKVTNNTSVADALYEPLATAFAPVGAAHTVLSSGGPSYTCEDFWTKINEGIESAAFEDGLEAALSQHFSKYKNDTTTGGRYIAALDNLVDTKTDFFKAVIFERAVTKARADHTLAGGGGSSSTALEDALNQRRWKNYGTASLVFETITQTMTFIEGWTLCILPLIVLLFLIGAPGVKLGAKYFWLLVWIQLWYPTILITTGIMDAMTKSTENSTTYSVSAALGFLDEMYRIQDVGYLFLSLSTMLSMFLIYGASSIMASSIQRDLTGGQHYDEKKNAPDSFSRAPAVQYENAFSHTAIGGYQANNPLADIKFTLSHQRASGVTKSDGENFIKTGDRSYIQGTQLTDAAGINTGRQNITGETRRDIATSSSDVSVSSGNRIDSSDNISSDTRDLKTTTSSLSTNAGAGFGAGNGAASANVGAGAGLQANKGQHTVEGAGSKTGASKSYDETTRSAEGSARSTEAMEGLTATTGAQHQAGAASSEATSETSSEQTSNVSSFNATEKMEMSSGMQASYNGFAIATRLGENSGLMNDMRQTMHDAGISNAVENYMLSNARLLDKTFMGPNAENAKEAFSFLMVTEGMAGNPWAGQGYDSDRAAMLNALGDEYIYAVTYADNRPQFEDGRDLDAAAQADPELRESMAGVTAEAQKRKQGVDSYLQSFQFSGNPERDVEEMMSGATNKLNLSTRGEYSAFLESAVDSIISHYKLDEIQKSTFAASIHEHGLGGAVRNLIMNDDEVDKFATGQVYESSVVQSGGSIGTFGALKGDVTAEEILASRMSDFERMGVNKGDPIAQYMALTQLESGARVHAGSLFNGENSEDGKVHTAMADDFLKLRSKLVDENESLRNEGEGYSNAIGKMALLSANSDEGFKRVWPAANMIGEISEREEMLSSKFGSDVRSDGSTSDYLPALSAGDGMIGNSELSGNDRHIVISTIIGEAANESEAGQAAVAHVIKNRVEDPRFGSDASAVALAPKQFSAWNSGAGGNDLVRKYGPGDALYERVGQIVDGVWSGQIEDMTNGATHYYSPKGMEHLVETGAQQNLLPRWLQQENAARGHATVQIGGHIFTGKAQT